MSHILTEAGEQVKNKDVGRSKAKLAWFSWRNGRLIEEIESKAKQRRNEGAYSTKGQRCICERDGLVMASMKI
jgi:hypothetical protein